MLTDYIYMYMSTSIINYFKVKHNTYEFTSISFQFPFYNNEKNSSVAYFGYYRIR